LRQPAEHLSAQTTARGSEGQKSITEPPHHLADLPDDLAELIAAWPALPDAIRTGILAMIHSAKV